MSNTTRVASRSACSVGCAASQSGTGYDPTVVVRITGAVVDASLLNRNNHMIAAHERAGEGTACHRRARASTVTQGDVMLYTRRELGKMALAGLPAGVLLDSRTLRAATKPNSRWAGVQVGMNVPYNFGPTPVLTADEVLQKCID